MLRKNIWMYLYQGIESHIKGIVLASSNFTHLYIQNNLVRMKFIYLTNPASAATASGAYWHTTWKDHYI